MMGTERAAVEPPGDVSRDLRTTMTVATQRRTKWEARREAAKNVDRGPGMISLSDELAELDRLEAQESKRSCLRCGRVFDSAGPGNRLCGACR